MEELVLEQLSSVSWRQSSNIRHQTERVDLREKMLSFGGLRDAGIFVLRRGI